MNYGKLTAGTTKTAIDTAKPSEKGEIITYLSRMGDVLDNIDERNELIVLLVGTVHTTIDGNEPHVILWECDLGIHPHFQIISADATHVLRDDRTDLSVFHQRHHALPIRSLKVCACVTVIHKELRIAEAVFLCISAEIGFLIHNAVTVAL